MPLRGSHSLSDSTAQEDVEGVSREHALDPASVATSQPLATEAYHEHAKRPFEIRSLPRDPVRDDLSESLSERQYGNHDTTTDGDEQIRSTGLPHLMEREVDKDQYGGTGFSDDGRSLTPDPHSSEAETEHMTSEDEGDDDYGMMQADQRDSNLRQNTGEEAQQDYLEDDIPADLDALSDVNSLDDIHRKGADLSDGELLSENDQIEAEASENESLANDDEPLDTLVDEGDDQASVDNNDDDEEIDGSRDHSASNNEAEENEALKSEPRTPEEHDDTASRPDLVDNIATSPGRKRKRSSPVSPGVSKRLAPRKVQADLDSDEEAEEDVLLSKAAASLIDRSEGQKNARAELVEHMDKMTGVDADSANEAPETPILLSTAEVEEGEEVEDEDEIEEEEVQDDNEREERTKHRQSAMEALRQIEIDFAKLRATLYDERLKQISRELDMAENGQHPLILQKSSQNQIRHSNRVRRAEILRDRRVAEADVMYRAQKFVAHSQFAQDKQKLRAALLSKTSAEWFQIHREKRVVDMAVPEYGYVVPDRKIIQAKNRRDYEAEVSILAGLKKFIGFPAAPIISVASSKDIDSDMTEMGLVKLVATNAREHHKASHLSHQHNTNHAQVTMLNHLNHHPHAIHAHSAHPTGHSKTHHRKQNSSMSQLFAADKPDHHAQSHYLQPRSSSPQVLPKQSHSHNFHESVSSRKSSGMPATFAPASELERKSILHSLDHDTKQLGEIKDRLPFPAQTLPHPQSNNFHRDGPALGSALHFGQKQAQNLPNILRQDGPENKSKQQLPALAHIASNGGQQSNSDYSTSNSGKSKFATQFWSPKGSDPNRQPIPALSSNSAFNATLSQPGTSAAYIPPSRAYSPASQSQQAQAQQSSMYKSTPVQNTHAQLNPAKPFQTGSHYIPSTNENNPATAASQSALAYSSITQHNHASESHPLFGVPQQASHQETQH